MLNSRLLANGKSSLGPIFLSCSTNRTVFRNGAYCTVQVCANHSVNPWKYCACFYYRSAIWSIYVYNWMVLRQKRPWILTDLRHWISVSLCHLPGVQPGVRIVISARVCSTYRKRCHHSYWSRNLAGVWLAHFIFYQKAWKASINDLEKTDLFE